MLLPPINGATAITGTPYFTENPGDPFKAWDASVTFDYMPASTLLFAPSLIIAMQVCRTGLVPAAITVTRRYLCQGGLPIFGTPRTFSIFPYLSISSAEQPTFRRHGYYHDASREGAVQFMMPSSALAFKMDSHPLPLLEGPHPYDEHLQSAQTRHDVGVAQGSTCNPAVFRFELQPSSVAFSFRAVHIRACRWRLFRGRQKTSKNRRA